MNFFMKGSENNMFSCGPTKETPTKTQAYEDHCLHKK